MCTCIYIRMCTCIYGTESWAGGSSFEGLSCLSGSVTPWQAGEHPERVAVIVSPISRACHKPTYNQGKHNEREAEPHHFERPPCVTLAGPRLFSSRMTVRPPLLPPKPIRLTPSPLSLLVTTAAISPYDSSASKKATLLPQPPPTCFAAKGPGKKT